VGADAVRAIVLRSVLTGANLRPRNPLAARGGTAPEPVAEVKALAPDAIRAEQRRAVAAEDYARLAERHPGVQRAAAVLRWTGSWQEVLVAIDPVRSTEPDTDLLAEIAGHLHPFRRMGHDLVVRPARYVPLLVLLRVCVLPHHLRGHVQRALLDIFSNRALPGGRRGFFHPDNLTFGEDVSVSGIVATAQAVPGVESVTVEQLERLFEGPNREIETGFLPLGPLEVARLDNDPSLPENGRLLIEVRGGR
jgi:predicted phage baseplate assembly protein